MIRFRFQLILSGRFFAHVNPRTIHPKLPFYIDRLHRSSTDAALLSYPCQVSRHIDLDLGVISLTVSMIDLELGRLTVREKGGERSCPA